MYFRRYKFARRASAADGSVKDIAHIWEIAGGVGSLDLLKVHAVYSFVDLVSSSSTRFLLLCNPLTLLPSPSSSVWLGQQLPTSARVPL